MILNILPCAYWLSIYVPEEVLLQMFWPYFIYDDYGTSNWKYLIVKVKAMHLRIPWTETDLKTKQKKPKEIKENT